MDSSSKQLFLDFSKTQADFSRENFIATPQNEKALSFLEKFFSQQEFSQNTIPSAILRGEKRSGKTHLVNIFAQEKSAKIIDAQNLEEKNLVAFFQKNQFYILENIDQLNDDKLLFHIVNAAFEARAFLLMTQKSQQNFELKDLNSRIKNILVTKIENPDEEMLEILLIKEFSNRQLKLNNDLIKFLAKNIERKYDEIEKIADEIEKFCFEKGKKPALQDLRVII